MGFSVGNKKGPISDINVTPLVDVMLVLLVIFMISAPLMFSGINLNLPKTKKVNTLNLSKQQTVLSITSSGQFYIGKEKYLRKELLGELSSKLQKSNNKTLFLRADFKLRYGVVAEIMSELKKHGITNIALVTEIDK